MPRVVLGKHKKICFEFTLKSGEKAWIRNMRPEDVETVCEIECIVFDDPWSLSSFQHEVARSAVSWPLVAETAHEIIGYAIPWYVADEMHLANIATSPLYVRQGVASQLMMVMLDEALRRGVKRVYLEVRPSNRAAIQLYKRFGFEGIGLRKRYYRNGEDAIVMQRFLPERAQPVSIK